MQEIGSHERSDAPAHAHSVTAANFQEAMSRLASSVHIVTTNGSGGLGGITASSVSSVSAEPPMMLFCINKRSSSLARFLANRCFCINTLAPRDRSLSDIFAGRTSERTDQRFASGIWRQAATGAPVLVSALAAFDCRLLEAKEVSTHFVMLGLVEAVDVSPEQATLLYTRRRYAEV